MSRKEVNHIERNLPDVIDVGCCMLAPGAIPLRERL